MEDLAPPLRLLLQVRNAMENGESIRAGTQRYLEDLPDDYQGQVKLWMGLFMQGLSTSQLLNELKSPYRRNLLRLLERGLRGESIASAMLVMEKEIIDSCENEIRAHLESLHFKILLPILLMQFPAFLLLLFGPIVGYLLQSF